MQTRMGPLDYFPTKKFKITIDSAAVVNSGTVPAERAGEIVKEMKWTLNKSGLGKNHLMVLDMLAHNNWKRPIYFSLTTGGDSYVGLQEYFQVEGLAYRLVPIKGKSTDGQTGKVYTDAMYDNLMNKFRFGNMKDPKVYLDETNMRMTMNLRNNFYRLSNALIDEGKNEKAGKTIDYCLQEIPDESVSYNYFILPMVEGYYKIGETEKADKLAFRMIDIFDEQLEYYFLFKGDRAKMYDYDKQHNLSMLQRLMQVASQNKAEEVSEKVTEVFDLYYGMYAGQ
jgi:tetratricopeptide (TPR) repeat protein